MLSKYGLAANVDQCPFQEVCCIFILRWSELMYYFSRYKLPIITVTDS
jgi:hypothetical protein